MSSPKRAAKDALRRAATSARQSRAAAPPVKPRANDPNGVSADAKRVAAAMERSIAGGRLDLLSADALQALMAAACRVYTARRQAGEPLTPVARDSVSATDVMVTASGLLQAADLAAFDLGLWQNWTGR